MKLSVSLSAFGIFLLFSFTSFSQELNTSFEMPLLVKQADIYKMKHLDNGKLLLGGRIDFYDDTKVNHLIRLNEDGSLDETFNPGSEIGVVKTFQVLPTDEIVVGTNSTVYLMTSEGVIVNSVTLADNEEIDYIELDGGYLWIGMGWNNSTFNVVRYTSDLQIDNSFDELSMSGNIYGMAIHQSKVLVSGFALKKNGVSLDPIVRFNADGTLDETFSLDIEIPADYGSIENLFFKKLLVGSDDKILVETNGYNGILKLNANGSQDFDFIFDEVTFRHVGLDDILLDEEDSIHVVGYSNYYGNGDSYDRRIYKYGYDGNPAPNFQNSLLSWKNIRSPVIEVGSDGTIFLANINDLNNRYGLNKLSRTGVLSVYAPQVGTYGLIDVAEIKGDKFVIAGDFNRLDQFITNDIAVLNLDGSADEGFQHTGQIERTPTDIDFYDGSIYLANETEVHKFQSNGEVDMAFNTKPEFLWNGFPVIWFCSNIHIQEDGKIVTTSPNGVFRMLANGNPDNSFGPFYPSITSTAFASDMQMDGKVVFGGHFDEINGGTFEDMVRINEDGTFDDTFQVERDASLMYGPGITDITSLTNNETIVFGYFDRFGGYETPRRIVKLDQEGKVDKRFLSFLNKTFTVEAGGFKNYTSFRGGFVVTGYDDYYIENDEFVFNYQIYSFNNSGIYQSQFVLPDGYKASTEIIPLVITNNDVILISKFMVEGREPQSGIRLKINNLPKIVDYDENLRAMEASLEISFEHLVVDDSDNVYPDDFEIHAYEGDNFTVDGNTIIPRAGFNGIIEVPVTVTEGSNESNHVLVPIIVGDGITTGINDQSLEIYPNPTSGMVEIKSDQEYTVEIRDIAGNLIQSSITNKKIDLSQFESGVYVFKMIGKDGKIYVNKVVKQ